MKAMILAAGRGKRLRSLTNALPKVLVPVSGVPMLERLMAYLVAGGVEALAINTHHLAAQVQVHAAGLIQRFPAWPPLQIFHEPELLDTGGGVANLASFWGEQPLLVWNGDVLADLPPAQLFQSHCAQKTERPPLATLAVQERESGSYLEVDEADHICGIDSPRRKTRRQLRQPVGMVRLMAYNGICLLQPALRGYLPPGPSDLITGLMKALAGGETLTACNMQERFWGTTGTPEQLKALEVALAEREALRQLWSASCQEG